MSKHIKVRKKCNQTNQTKHQTVKEIFEYEAKKLAEEQEDLFLQASKNFKLENILIMLFVILSLLLIVTMFFIRFQNI